MRLKLKNLPRWLVIAPVNANEDCFHYGSPNFPKKMEAVLKNQGITELEVTTKNFSLPKSMVWHI